MAFTVSAPGKTILFGEHAVVHGVPAIAASVALHTFVSVEESSSTHFVELDFPYVKLATGWELSAFEKAGALNRHETTDVSKIDTELDEEILKSAHDIASSTISAESPFARTAATAFLYLYIAIYLQSGTHRSKPQSGLRFTTTGTLPIGAGLGSSASFSVCISAALLKLSGQLTPNTPHDVAMDLVTKWSFLGESCIHGKPSGIDNLVATRGGAVFFQRPKPGAPPTAKPVILPYTQFPELGLILTDTCVSRHTSELVAKVGQIKKDWPQLFDSLMVSFEQIVNEANTLLKNAEKYPDFAEKVGELADINHGLLVAVGVSHPALELVRETSKELRIGRTKLTGAGGGGCAITITPQQNPDIAEFKARLSDFRVFVTKLGGPGVGWADEVAKTPADTEKLNWNYW